MSKPKPSYLWVLTRGTELKFVLSRSGEAPEVPNWHSDQRLTVTNIARLPQFRSTILPRLKRLISKLLGELRDIEGGGPGKGSR